MKVIHIFLILVILLFYNRVCYSDENQNSSKRSDSLIAQQQQPPPPPPPSVQVFNYDDENSDYDDNDEYDASTSLSDDDSGEGSSHRVVAGAPPPLLQQPLGNGSTQNYHGLPLIPELKCENKDDLRNAICRYLNNLNVVMGNRSNLLNDQKAIWNEYTGLTHNHFKEDKYNELKESVNRYNLAIENHQCDQKELVKTYAEVADNYLKAVPKENKGLHDAASAYQKAAALYSNAVINGNPEKVQDTYNELVSSHRNLVNVYTDQFVKLTSNHSTTVAQDTKSSPPQGDAGSGASSSKTSRKASSKVPNHGREPSTATLRDTQVGHQRLESEDDNQQSEEIGSTGLTPQTRLQQQPKTGEMIVSSASHRHSFISQDSSNDQKENVTLDNPSGTVGEESVYPVTQGPPGTTSPDSSDSSKKVLGRVRNKSVNRSNSVSSGAVDSNVLPKAQRKGSGRKWTLAALLPGRHSDQYEENQKQNLEPNANKSILRRRNTWSPGEYEEYQKQHSEPNVNNKSILRRRNTWSPDSHSSLFASQKLPREKKGLVDQASEGRDNVNLSNPVITEGATLTASVTPTAKQPPSASSSDPVSGDNTALSPKPQKSIDRTPVVVTSGESTSKVKQEEGARIDNPHSFSDMHGMDASLVVHQGASDKPPSQKPSLGKDGISNDSDVTHQKLSSSSKDTPSVAQKYQNTGQIILLGDQDGASPLKDQNSNNLKQGQKLPQVVSKIKEEYRIKSELIQTMTQSALYFVGSNAPTKLSYNDYEYVKKINRKLNALNVEIYPAIQKIESLYNDKTVSPNEQRLLSDLKKEFEATREKANAALSDLKDLILKIEGKMLNTKAGQQDPKCISDNSNQFLQIVNDTSAITVYLGVPEKEGITKPQE